MSITQPLNSEEHIPINETNQQQEISKGGQLFLPSKAEGISYQSRNYEAYLALLFPDEAESENRNVECFKRDHEEVIKSIAPDIETVCGGRRNFFKEGVHILDIGSGAGKALQEINALYGNRGVRVIGIDALYAQEMPIGLTSDTAIAGNWQHMPFEDNSFDRLLSCESNLRHLEGKVPRKLNPTFDDMVKAALGIFGEKDIQTVLEATRVAKEGAIWRATQVSGLNKNDLFLNTMTENGWEVFFYGRTMIAQLIQKKSK